MNATFNSIAASATVIIPFNAKWANGTGYYDHAVSGDAAPVLEKGQWCASFDESTLRNIAMVGTEHGNCVFFQRYSQPNNYTVVCNVPRNVKRKYNLNSSVSDEMLEFFISEVSQGFVDKDESEEIVEKRKLQYVQPVAEAAKEEQVKEEKTTEAKKKLEEKLKETAKANEKLNINWKKISIYAAATAAIGTAAYFAYKKFAS